MLGKFIFRKSEPSEGWDVSYKGPKDSKFTRLCHVQRAHLLGLAPPNDTQWVAFCSMSDVAGMAGKAEGGHDTRFGAALAFLGGVLDAKSDPIERFLRASWDTRRGDPEAPLPAALASDVYDVLIAHCRAPAADKDHFVRRQAESVIPEWRFGGLLGFGGKFWNANSSLYVTAYSEDTGPETRLIIAEADRALLALVQPAGG